MNVDTEALREIREFRARTDPLIPHPRKQAWLESTPDNFLELAVEAREDRLADAPVDKPIQKATWVEATVFCFTRSMDSGIDQFEHLGAYQHCFEQMSTDQLEWSFSEMMPDSMEIVTTDEHKELAETFREYIASAQHTIFVEERYDDTEFNTSNIPKAFWRRDIPDMDGSGDAAESTDKDQFTLTDY